MFRHERFSFHRFHLRYGNIASDQLDPRAISRQFSQAPSQYFLTPLYTVFSLIDALGVCVRQRKSARQLARLDGISRFWMTPARSTYAPPRTCA